MHVPPPVSVRATGGRRWRALRALLPALAAAVGTTWILQWTHGVAGVTAGGIGLVIGAAVAVLAWRAAAPRPATLAWDGTTWSLDGTAGRADVMLDLPGWLLVRLRPAARGPVRWVAVSGAEAGADDTLLRAALHAGANAAAAGEPPGPRARDA